MFLWAAHKGVCHVEREREREREREKGKTDECSWKSMRVRGCVISNRFVRCSMAHRPTCLRVRVAVQACVSARVSVSVCVWVFVIVCLLLCV